MRSLTKHHTHYFNIFRYLLAIFSALFALGAQQIPQRLLGAFRLVFVWGLRLWGTSLESSLVVMNEQVFVCMWCPCALLSMVGQ